MKTRKEELREEVRAFHEAHPEVWRHCEQYAFDLVRAGRRRFGIGAIWERLRWESMVNPSAFGEGELKLNNNYRAFYARALMKKYPELEDFFETRVQKSENEPARSTPPFQLLP